jgi:hypothetical protein
VIRGALETVAFEMATHVSLTATTPILNQSNERNATILDARGRLAALSVGIPQFMLSSTLPVRFPAVKVYERASSDATWCTCSRSTTARRRSSATCARRSGRPSSGRAGSRRSRCATAPMRCAARSSTRSITREL